MPNTAFSFTIPPRVSSLLGWISGLLRTRSRRQFVHPPTPRKDAQADAFCCRRSVWICKDAAPRPAIGWMESDAIYSTSRCLTKLNCVVLKFRYFRHCSRGHSVPLARSLTAAGTARGTGKLSSSACKWANSSRADAGEKVNRPPHQDV